MGDAIPEISIVDTHLKASAWVSDEILYIKCEFQCGSKRCGNQVAISLFMLSQIRGTKEDRANVIKREFFRHELPAACDPIAKLQHDEFLEKYGQKICDHFGINLCC